MHAVVDAESLLVFLAKLDGVYDAPPPLGDPVDLLAHGLQCAAVLHNDRPDDLGLQLAGLVHDIGHAVGDDPDHARVGADVVRPVLGPRVADLVALHVPAKRYLASTESDYELSEASRLSLLRQGSVMTGEEQEKFLANPAAADAVTLRRADEAAKIVGHQVPGLDVWAPRLLTYAGGV